MSWLYLCLYMAAGLITVRLLAMSVGEPEDSSEYALAGLACLLWPIVAVCALLSGVGWLATRGAKRAD